MEDEQVPNKKGIRLCDPEIVEVFQKIPIGTPPKQVTQDFRDSKEKAEWTRPSVKVT